MADLPQRPDLGLQSPSTHAAGQRRPSLLPAFEPLSSSPGLPRPAKRKLDELIDDRAWYPTPVPTSSTGILPSSSPSRRTRPGLQRSVSMLSERAPLGDVPSLDIPATGEPILMGRSSNSSDYQLSSNRAISRVHVRASFLAPTSEHVAGKVEVECLGWNGCKVHCSGEVVELQKGECFVSDKPMVQIMVDVQDTRVLLKWPSEETREKFSLTPKAKWASESPTKKRVLAAELIASSPPALLPPRPATPSSPSPNVNFGSTFSSTFRAGSADEGPVQVYEDHSSDEDAPCEIDPDVVDCEATPTRAAASRAPEKANLSHSTNAESDELSEHDEENDPIITSFGPYGENLLSRLDSFKATSPERKRKPLTSSHHNSPSNSMSSPSKSLTNLSPVKNHVVNQLAFSRIHSLPLSTIHANLPSELRGAMVKPSDHENRQVLSASSLKTLLDEIPCVGEISREGKDAAGKLLESEFYYMPEHDTDEMRRETVMQSLGKTSIRAARKSHKQYYWKRPRH